MSDTSKLATLTTYDAKEDQHVDVVNDRISPQHEAFLLARHQTCDLDPLPSSDASDPLNWPSWKVSHNDP
jgi:hypothetical protein